MTFYEISVSGNKELLPIILPGRARCYEELNDGST
jgi:hypothetical protein